MCTAAIAQFSWFTKTDMDFPGLWKHFTVPAEALDEAAFEDGIGFDGSSIRGWQAINESDMRRFICLFAQGIMVAFDRP